MSTIIKKTRHAQKRCQQRGITDYDIFLIRKYGKQENDGDIVYTLTRGCVVNIIPQLRHKNYRYILQRLDHLIGWCIVFRVDILITVYPLTRHRNSRRRKRGYSRYRKWYGKVRQSWG